MKTAISSNQVIVGVAAFLTAFANLAFFRNLLATFGTSTSGYAHVLSLGLVLWCLLIVLLSLLWSRHLGKPLLISLLLISAGTAYFMDTYNVIIDSDMVANVAATNYAESADLLTPRLAVYLLLLGALPATILGRLTIRRQALLPTLRSRLKLLAVTVVVLFSLVLLSGGFYASFIREHKALRYYTNPTTPIYGLFRYVRDQFDAPDGPPTVIGDDARRPPADIDRELVILVVGETARTDRFSLNGYERDTNPRLSQEDVISFTQVSSCGTSTAVSVPCMFAIYTRDEFDDKRAKGTENLLDVLQRAGVNVLWRDNNSDSKGVATRIAFEDFRSPQRNPLCDPECRDVGMLDGLQAYIDDHAEGDILIVLHSMGSHGPAYHKRYPAEFRRFEPTCETSQLDSCGQAEISNTYDNTILYTDHFLAEVINLLRTNDDRFETAMLYVSDHGESLGETGVYLHGLPYFVAPDAQTHVPVIAWFGRNYDDVDLAAMRQLRDVSYSHDHIFHSMLGMFEIKSSVYDRDKDILHQARVHSGAEPEFD